MTDDSATLRADHERIWLEPRCGAPFGERSWCAEKLEPCPDFECGMEPTEYVRADLYESLLVSQSSWAKEKAELERRNQELNRAARLEQMQRISTQACLATYKSALGRIANVETQITGAATYCKEQAEIALASRPITVKE